MLHVSPVMGSKIGGVMPKEAFKTENEKVVVGWSKENGYVEIAVNLGEDSKIQVLTLGKKNEIKYGSFFNDIYATFEDEEEFNKFLKVLKRAGKQAFKKS